MKKIILAVTAAAMVMSQAPRAEARVNGWVLAGGILGGVALGSALSHHETTYCAPAPVYYYPQPVYQTTYVAPAPVCATPAPVCAAPAPTTVVAASPAPVVVYQAPPPQVVYVPAPTVVYAQPAVVYSQPVISVGFGLGGGYRGHHYRRW